MLTISRLLLALTVALGPLVLAPGASAATAYATSVERRLRALHCDVGAVDGRLDQHARAGILRFQSANGVRQSARMSAATRQALRSTSAVDCLDRPVPRRTGRGRRIVVSQGQNYVWLVGRSGRAVHQGPLIDNQGLLATGRYRTGSYCGRAGRILHNSDYGGSLELYGFVRFAPCGFGFHQVPTYRSTGAQIHPDWLLGTERRASHGCLRLSRPSIERVWDFTRRETTVVVTS